MSVQRICVGTAFLAGLFLAGCGRPQGGPPGDMVPEVATVEIFQQQVVLTTELPGRTSPYRIAEIRPQVSGLIQKRLFTEGSDLQAGQELYQIDPAPFQAALEHAQAALERVEANLPTIRSRAERYQELLGDNAVSQQEYDDVAAALSQGEADIRYFKAKLKIARINLNYTRVVSPIFGRIGTSTVTNGAIVTAYQPMALATIQQLDPIYVDVPQSTSELLRWRHGLDQGRISRDEKIQNSVQLILEDGSKYSLEGTFQFRDVSVDPTTASVILRVVFPNPEGILLPGMFVRTLVKEGVNEQAILIPQQAVSLDAKGNSMVLIVDASGMAQRRMLTLDRAVGNQWLVTSGLAPGDRVIVEGLQRARPGAPVKEVRLDAGGTGTVSLGNAPQPAPASN